jgi:hypothetical protein
MIQTELEDIMLSEMSGTDGQISQCSCLYVEAETLISKVQNRIMVTRAWERCGEGGIRKRTANGYGMQLHGKNNF